jgi:hypothetical protein
MGCVRFHLMLGLRPVVGVKLGQALGEGRTFWVKVGGEK